MDTPELINCLERVEASLHYANVHREGDEDPEDRLTSFIEALRAALPIVRDHAALTKKLGELSESLTIETISNRKAREALVLWDAIFPESLAVIAATAGPTVAAAVKATHKALGK